MIVDKPGTWKQIKPWIQAAPQNDPEYVTLSCAFKRCFLRALISTKTNFIPHAIQWSGSEITDKFTKLFNDHFNSPTINWLYQQKLYSEGQLDQLSDPTHNCPNITYDDLLHFEMKAC